MVRKRLGTPALDLAKYIILVGPFAKPGIVLAGFKPHSTSS